jgi:hypothetical protein
MNDLSTPQYSTPKREIKPDRAIKKRYRAIFQTFDNELLYAIQSCLYTKKATL